ncbi:MAG: glycosyltransferase family 2 protein [Rhabdochlamydiaceae bacterium]|nr:glycosyltransferase family 2 protein [Rhabdochlamydiaceae bacterium]
MITVTILTKNSENSLKATLDSVKDFSEVLLFDTGSTDQTLKIAAEYPNVKIIQDTFIGFGPTHNKASSLATYDWILSLDSDEVLTDSLSKEILTLALDPKSIYQIQRKNYFNGKWIKGCGGWHPDWVIRLYNRTATRFSGDAVHEKIISKGLFVRALAFPILHTPYRNMSDFLAKMQTYSTLFAEQNKGRKSASLLKALLHGWSAFLKSYLLKRGCFCGKEGFIISLYNGHTAFYKYLKLSEK